MDSKSVHTLASGVPKLTRKLDLGKFEVSLEPTNSIDLHRRQIQNLHPSADSRAYRTACRLERRLREGRLREPDILRGV